MRISTEKSVKVLVIVALTISAPINSSRLKVRYPDRCFVTPDGLLESLSLVCAKRIIIKTAPNNITAPPNRERAYVTIVRRVTVTLSTVARKLLALALKKALRTVPTTAKIAITIISVADKRLRRGFST
jgi:hypothetical protein